MAALLTKRNKEGLSRMTGIVIGDHPHHVVQGGHIRQEFFFVDDEPCVGRCPNRAVTLSPNSIKQLRLPSPTEN